MKNQDHRCPNCGGWYNEDRSCDNCKFGIKGSLGAEPYAQFLKASKSATVFGFKMLSLSREDLLVLLVRREHQHRQAVREAAYSEQLQ